MAPFIVPGTVGLTADPWTLLLLSELVRHFQGRAILAKFRATQVHLIGFLVIFRLDLFALGTSPLMGATEKLANAWKTFRTSHLWGRWATLWPSPSCLPVK